MGEGLLEEPEFVYDFMLTVFHANNSLTVTPKEACRAHGTQNPSTGGGGSQGIALEVEVS